MKTVEAKKVAIGPKCDRCGHELTLVKTTGLSNEYKCGKCGKNISIHK